MLLARHRRKQKEAAFKEMADKEVKIEVVEPAPKKEAVKKNVKTKTTKND
ncbi:hypothetical protein AAHH17_16475 [Lysinibacillus capsici]